MTVDVSDMDLENAVNLVHHKFGIVIHPHQRVDLKRNIAKIAEKNALSTASLLLKRIYDEDHTSDIVRDFVTAITVDESYFFRGKEQLAFLEKTYFPNLIAIKQKMGIKTLRIWSAGSSNGQEIYTIAMLLKSFIPTISDWSIYLLATDINHVSLDNARKGVYHSGSMRAIDSVYQIKYFTEMEGGKYLLDESIRKMVSFEYLNLLESHYRNQVPEMGNFDLILCRNVFIYFDTDTIKQVLTQLAKEMVQGGILILGNVDIIRDEVEGLKTHWRDDVIYFEKEVPALTAFADQMTRDDELAVTLEQDEEQGEEDINQMQTTETPTYFCEEKEQIQHCIDNQEWTQAQELIENNKHLIDDDPRFLCLNGIVKTKIGEYRTAISLISRAMEYDNFDPIVYYYKGVLLQHFQEDKEAMQMFKSALFLKPDFIEAYYQVGLLELKLGNKEQGIKKLKSANTLAEKANSTDRVLHENVRLLDFSNEIKKLIMMLESSEVK